ncbi:MAG: enoyl-CoA hydratase/isomerase family protein [Hyphomonadaceae bacterium]|nr:MAG: enoyl-CoA hydratase/isomerase [Caulobacteraceae bacterium]MBT9445020.1 enoyl-CoA hydratase/isomerase family protein [Hyphomonadaceae bacterium]TPW02677.1 MAG: enoyl-CoA hydratase/isomerase [Alphaproteobacteria bacterium]
MRQEPAPEATLSESADIYLARTGRRAELVLNRPAKRNALSLAMWRAIPDLVAQVDADPDVRLLVVRGAGAHFAAGADIAEFETTYATREAALANQAVMARAMAALESFSKPSLAVIRGACVGGGCALALCCDLRFAATDARFGVTPAKLGLAYGVSDTRRLVQAVGPSAAKRILFTGGLIDAEEALRIGLVDAAHGDAALDGAVGAFEAELASASGFTARAVKQVMAMLRDGAIDDTAESRALFADAFEGPDFREGSTAFLAKRTPRFP